MSATPVNRSTKCPMLVRMFCRQGAHHRLDDYGKGRQPPVKDEIDVHTWPDATLRELSDLVKEVSQYARRKDVCMSFQLVYQDLHGVYRAKPIGHVGGDGKDDEVSLERVRFIQGDFIDIALISGDDAAKDSRSDGRQDDRKEPYPSHRSHDPNRGQRRF